MTATEDMNLKKMYLHIYSAFSIRCSWKKKNKVITTSFRKRKYKRHLLDTCK